MKLKTKHFISPNGTTKIIVKDEFGRQQELFVKVPPKKHGKVITLVHLPDNELISLYEDEIVSIKKNVRMDFGVRLGRIKKDGRRVVVKFNKRSDADHYRSTMRYADALLMDANEIII